jgi:hypothetical protein
LEFVDLHTVAPRWWAFTLRGLCDTVIAAASFRLALTSAPGPPGFNLAQAFGVLAVANGLLLVVFATGKSATKWAPAGPRERRGFLAEAAVGIVLGALALAWSGMPGWALRGVVCLYSVACGALILVWSEVTISNGNRSPAKSGWYIFGSLVSIVFGVAFAIWAQGTSAGHLFGAYAVTLGLCLLLVSAGLKQFSDNFC